MGSLLEAEVDFQPGSHGDVLSRDNRRNDRRSAARFGTVSAGVAREDRANFVHIVWSNEYFSVLFSIDDGERDLRFETC